MKIIYLAAAIILFCSCAGRKTTGNRKPMDSTGQVTGALPDCVKKLVAQIKAAEKTNPPRSIYSYTYHGKTVYYVTAPCCDFFSDLYDSACNLVAHPDGGFTGLGDQRAPDFIKQRKDEKWLWTDERK